MTDYKPRRKTKIPDRYKPRDTHSKTSSKRLEQLKKTYPGIEIATSETTPETVPDALKSSQ